MMKFLYFLLASLLVLSSCQAAKKAPKADDQKTAAEIKADYDYRTALQAYNIGINHIHAEELQDAILNLEKAVQLDGNNYRYRHGLGLAYSLNGQLEEAVAEFKKALAINPDFSETYNVLGTVYTDMELYDEAIECFKKVIKDKTYNQPQFAYFNLGKVMVFKGRIEEAVAAYKVATQLDPKFYRVYIALGEIFKDRKDYEQMLHYYQKAEPNYSNDVKVLYSIGYALFKLKRYERAKSYLAQVSILFPPPSIDKPTQDMLSAIENIMRRGN